MFSSNWCFRQFREERTALLAFLRTWRPKDEAKALYERIVGLCVALQSDDLLPFRHLLRDPLAVRVVRAPNQLNDVLAELVN